ncbi:MAG: methylmalonyl Co-A mutase-associated GTPase MeaB [Armatimonadetes bacterium]|nr:methylmalonyl Co-A mutase-associated GTPase MeaB [Armatimonadota bacterium]
MRGLADRVHRLAQGVLSGDRLATARAITMLENNHPGARELMERLAAHVGRAYRVGVTGPPGAGKSTLVDALAREARSRGDTVGVIAVDPSSPFSGGALLGDRVRMSRALEDPQVFVRSMAARGSLGGLARTAQEAMDVLDAFGKSLLLLETVGVGQSELAVAAACDLTVVVLVPEAGGVVQAMKAGLMEIADIFVVNKADRPGAEEMQQSLREAAQFLERNGWLPPVHRVVALDSRGVPELFDCLSDHRRWLQEGDRLEKKRLEQSAQRIRELVRAGLEERLWRDPSIRSTLDLYALRLQSGELGLYGAAVEVWNQIRERLAATRLESAWEDAP